MDMKPDESGQEPVRTGSAVAMAGLTIRGARRAW